MSQWIFHTHSSNRLSYMWASKNIEQHVMAGVDLWRVLTGWMEVKFHGKILFWKAFWKKSAKQARDDSPIIYELVYLGNRFPSMHIRPLIIFTTSVQCNSWPNPYTHGLYKPFRSLPVFKRECISCFCLNWFISLVYLSTAVLYPCSKCRYLVHVEDLSHILKEVYIVAIHTRIGL